MTEDDDEAVQKAEQEFEAAKEKTAHATYSVISVGAVVFIEIFWDFKTKLEKGKEVVLKSLDQCYIEQTGKIHMRHNKPDFVERSEQLLRILVGDRKERQQKKATGRQLQQQPTSNLLLLRTETLTCGFRIT